MNDTIGFIGLGIMGKPMARNLMKAGCKLIVHDLNRAPVEELVAEGAADGCSPAGVAEKAGTLITMLPDGPDVEKVVCGDNGIAQGITAGAVVVDMSSISPIVSRRVADALQKAEAHYVDAPVSGGEPRAIDGTLAIMVGGREDVVEQVRPLLAHMGKSVVRVGDVGAGQTAKLVNQVLVALHIQAMGEAFLLATGCGADCEAVFEAVRSGLAGSNVLNAKVPLVLERNFNPGFKMKLHQKDLRNAMAAADEYGLDLPATKVTRDLLAGLVDGGHGEEDHGGLVQAVEQLNGSKIGQ